tara:strand:+ start:909 stop:1145 length:237 start_codon:yes stop_codon:yes gene_type:complete
MTILPALAPMSARHGAGQMARFDDVSVEATFYSLIRRGTPERSPGNHRAITGRKPAMPRLPPNVDIPLNAVMSCLLTI